MVKAPAKVASVGAGVAWARVEACFVVHAGLGVHGLARCRVRGHVRAYHGRFFRCSRVRACGCVAGIRVVGAAILWIGDVGSCV